MTRLCMQRCTLAELSYWAKRTLMQISSCTLLSMCRSAIHKAAA